MRVLVFSTLETNSQLNSRNRSLSYMYYEASLQYMPHGTYMYMYMYVNSVYIVGDSVLLSIIELKGG